MLHTLLEKTFSAGANFDEELNPDLYAADGSINYLRKLHVLIDLVDVVAGTADAVTVIGWYRLLEYFQIRDRKGRGIISQENIHPAALRAMGQLLDRKGPTDPALLAANANATVTRTLHLVINFDLDKALAMRHELEKPAAFYNRITGKFGAIGTTIFGVGHVITQADTKLRVVAEYAPRQAVMVAPTLTMEKQAIAKFLQQPFDLGGGLLAAALVDVTTADTGTMGATDFVTAQWRAGALSQARDPVDNAARAYNSAIGDAHDAELPMPTSGSARTLPLYVAPDRAELGELVDTPRMVASFYIGAGAPTISEQFFYAAVIKDREEARWAELFELASGGVTKAATVLGRVRAGVLQGKAGTTGRSRSAAGRKIPAVVAKPAR